MNANATATRAPMSTTLVMRAEHIRTRDGRACPCCATVRPRDAVRMRRQDRRTARQALRNLSPVS